MDVLADPDIRADVDTATPVQEGAQSGYTGHDESESRQQPLENAPTHSNAHHVVVLHLRYNTTPIVIANKPIEIWLVPFSLSEEAVNRLDRFLSSEERLRSMKLHLTQDQRRYTISQAALRFILARYLDYPAGNIVFGCGAFGKPFLDQPPAGFGILFNLSHCIDMSARAAASSRNIRVDVEKERVIPELEQIAQTHFNRDECSLVESETGTERTRSFLRIWTRREAAAKALGQNLSEALSRVTIPVSPPGTGTPWWRRAHGS